MKSALITMVICGTILATAFGIFYLNKVYFLSVVTKARVEKNGEQLDCSRYSCEQLKAQGTRLTEYQYCLVDCGKSYIKVEDGNFVVIAPAGYEMLAKAHLQDLENCEPLLTGFLGITPDEEILAITFVKGEKTAAYAGAEGSGVFYYKTESALQSELKRIKSGAGIGVKEGHCLNAHELAHIYTNRLKLPHWANEGLATYVEWKFAGTGQQVECLSDGWRHTQGKNNKIALYSDLNKSWSGGDSAQNDWYNSAACVFDFIVKKFDASAVGGVLIYFDGVAAKSVPDEKIGLGMERFSTKTFFEKAIAPVLGQSVVNELKEKFEL